MIVSVSRGRAPRSRRLTPSGRWPEDPLTVVLEPGVGFEPAPDLKEAEQAGPNRTAAARPFTERVLLHLLLRPAGPSAGAHAGRRARLRWRRIVGGAAVGAILWLLA